MSDRTIAAYRRALLAGVGIFASYSLPVAAQQTPAAINSETDIIVTAQRRAERLENVPMSVTVLSPETLAKSGVNNVQDIGRIAPGVQVNFAGLSTQPAVRGVTTLTNGAFSENNIGIYVDGFYVPDTLSINSDLVNIQDVQVLKGPQGTLYGRNATGGAILINTLEPSKTWTGTVGAEYGRFNEYSLKGYISGPISDKIRVGLAGATRHGDGYIRFSTPPAGVATSKHAAPFTNQSVRFKLQADLSDTFTATLGLNYGLASDPRGNLYTPRGNQPATNPRPPAIATRPEEVSYNYDALTRAKTKEATLKLSWESDIGTLTSRTGYARRNVHYAFDFDGSYADNSYSDNYQKSRTFQQSLDYVITAIDKVDLLVGAFYYDDKVTPDAAYSSQAFGANHVPTTGATTVLGAKAWAVYVDGTFHLTDALSITAGGRYNHDKKSVFEFVQTISTGAYTLPPTSDKASFNKFTPRASIRLEVADRTNIYASYSKGYRSGAYNSNTVASPALLIPTNPETIDSYEIGFKTAQSNFRAEIAGFYYDYKNYNVSITGLNPLTGQPTTILGNAPKAKIYGIDGQISYSPGADTHVTFGGSWLHARYGSFANATGTGVTAAGLNASQTQDWTGKQMSRAPNFTANLSADQAFPLAGGKLVFAGNLAYTASYVISNPSLYGPLAPADIAGKQRFRARAHETLDAQINWTDPSGRYTVGVWGKNLTDARYRITSNGTSLFGSYAVLNAPITYGVRAGYAF